MSRRRYLIALGSVVVVGVGAAGVAVVSAVRATSCDDDFPRAALGRFVSAPVGDARLDPPDGKSEWSQLRDQASAPPEGFGLEPASWGAALDLPDPGARFSGPHAVAASDDLVAVAWAGAVAAFTPGGELRWARELPGDFGIFGQQGPTSLAVVDGHVVVAPHQEGFGGDADQAWVASFDPDGGIVGCRRLGNADAYVSDRDVVVIDSRPERDDPRSNASEVTRYRVPRLDEIWSVDVPGWPTRASSSDDYVVVDSDFSHGEYRELGYPALTVLDRETGAPALGVEIPTGRGAFSSVRAGPTVVSIVMDGGYADLGTVRGLGPAGRWQYGADVRATARLFAVGHNVLFAREGRGGARDSLALLDTVSGAELWRVESGNWSSAEPVMAPGAAVYASTSDLIRLDLVTGGQQRFELGDGRGDDVFAVALGGTRLYVAAEHGVLAFPLTAP